MWIYERELDLLSLTGHCFQALENLASDVRPIIAPLLSLVCLDLSSC